MRLLPRMPNREISVPFVGIKERAAVRPSAFVSHLPATTIPRYLGSNLPLKLLYVRYQVSFILCEMSLGNGRHLNLRGLLVHLIKVSAERLGAPY